MSIESQDKIYTISSPNNADETMVEPPLQMNPQRPSAPVYSSVPNQESNFQPLPPSYPNDPPPQYELPKGHYAPFPNQPGGQISCQVPFYPGGSPAYQHGPGIVPQPVVFLQEIELGPRPKEMDCPYCQAHIITATEFQVGALTWLASGLLCLFCCWTGCCLLPFCIGELQDVIHHCPNCDKVLGIHRRLN